MSKPKGKDKKPQNYEHLEKQYEEQKRELLDATFTLKKLQERLSFLTQQNHRLEKQREDQFHLLNEKIEELSIKNETNEKRLISMRNDLTNAQVENKKLINTINLQEKNSADERAERTKEYEEMRKNYNFEIAKFQNMLTDYKLYMGERDCRQKEINELIEAREMEIANRIRDVADKEREKVQATDKIRDEMGNKIRQMRQNLLSLKKEELQTTTRLTMLQNHQLTSELEYQSKQTEKIVFKNQELEATINKLRQELDIHKQVEDQLAKRSHFSKGIIKKLHTRVGELQEELGKTKESLKFAKYNEEESDISSKRGERPQRSMASAIDKQLQRSQKKYAELYIRYESLRKEKEDLSLKWQTVQRAKNQIFTALLRSYNEIIRETPLKQGEKENIDEISLDIQALKRKRVEDWNQEELRSVLLMLLQVTQPHLTKINLAVPALRKIVVFGESQQNYKNVLPKLSTDRQKKLIMSASESKFDSQDVCLLAKNDLSKDKLSLNIASRMVTSKLRDWGKPVSSKSKGSLQRKYKLSTSYRS